MFSLALIMFREVLEASLVVGILCAATADVPGRNRWVLFGIAMGLVGSGAVALMLGSISAAFEGMGQEVLNASVLLVSSICIIWTVVWMKRTAREFSLHVEQIGDAVAQGAKPLWALSMVSALSVLREGSEVALLSHGLRSTTQSSLPLLFGGTFGLCSALAVGMAVYFGLLRAATRRIFAVTSAMLVLLAAGMVSKAVGYLSAADLLSPLIDPVWDTSSILGDGTFIGQTLGVLIGYTAAPSASQLIGYLLTLCTTAWLLKRFGSAQWRGVGTAVCAALVVFVPYEARAIDEIYSPLVVHGELELEYRGALVTAGDEEEEGARGERFGVGYGLTDRLVLEGYVLAEDEPGEGYKHEGYELEARYQLWDQDQYWLDAGLYGAVEYEREDSEYEGELKLLLEKGLGRFVSTLNLIVERPLDSGDVEGGLSFKTAYRLMPEFEPGFELHSDVGEFGDSGEFGDQEHWAGPAVYSKPLPFLKLGLAYLFGVSDGAEDAALRWTVEFERYF